VTILQIAALATTAAIVGQIRRGRQPALLVISAFAIFWLQSSEPVPTLAFWFPFATLAIAVLAWALTSTPEVRGFRQNWVAAAMLASVAVIMDLNRYFGLGQIYTTATPRVGIVLGCLVGAGAVTFILLERPAKNWLWQAAMMVGILAVFVSLKTPRVTAAISNSMVGSPAVVVSAAGIPLSWLGFSYISFRILHTIRDRQSGRLPPVTLGEYVNYAIFFPAFTAGPIDRLERFVPELRVPLPLTDVDWIAAGTRLFVGAFKKFVVADLLAVISINDVLVQQVKVAGWLWVFLYAYAFRIYLDFSGYTDIAIGMGRLLGFRLPENFAAPYLKPNLAQFWNSWHMSLTQWFRSYVFNPLSRALRSGEHPGPVWLVILAAQVTTMLLIGLWHGVTLGFAAWGLWHALGLFTHNRWSDFARNRMPAWTASRLGARVLNAAGVALTFNYVALGWLFFGLSTPSLAWHALLRLFGST
jgi:D-alanyl-lipoteichoic acid acyltransferase DltB (MBOAT superfamily)